MAEYEKEDFEVESEEESEMYPDVFESDDDNEILKHFESGLHSRSPSPPPKSALARKDSISLTRVLLRSKFKESLKDGVPEH